ncbi:MAG: fasciclin [Bacillota bacterium]|nr:fasciclin [Bacillota bacterium]
MSFIGARVAIKAHDGKFLTIDNGSLKLKECDNELSHEITFYVPLAVNNVFVQAYTREFVSVKDNGEIGLVPCDYNLGQNEAFNFICLGMNRAAIVANNGKYVSAVNDKLGTVMASSASIGENETFEVILVFR